MAATPFADVRALVFDIFGTVVDWRGTLIREGEALGRRLGIAPAGEAPGGGWAALADGWRAGYAPAMQAVMRGELPWQNLDALHRRILDALLPTLGLGDLPEAERVRLNTVWHRLDPWPDSVAGLHALKRQRTIATLSNGHVALLVHMARRAGLPWDTVLSAELFNAYKPDPRVYQGAARLLGLAPRQVMMVAAHPSDLAAAQRAGLRTAYIPRPLERGPGGWVEPMGDLVVDAQAPDLPALAALLGDAGPADPAGRADPADLPA